MSKLLISLVSSLHLTLRSCITCQGLFLNNGRLYIIPYLEHICPLKRPAGARWFLRQLFHYTARFFFITIQQYQAYRSLFHIGANYSGGLLFFIRAWYWEKTQLQISIHTQSLLLQQSHLEQKCLQIQGCLTVRKSRMATQAWSGYAGSDPVTGLILSLSWSSHVLGITWSRHTGDNNY